jgi:EAL domain-containing protein (putative c-di-GMP-specific phosphodiesterase class I)
MRAAGCRFALDDFGSGLSSYRYLQELEVDVLKIDGAFVRTLVDNPVSLAIVNSINQIGHILGLTTVAEWVENDAILEHIRGLKVDLAQGHEVGIERRLTELV